MLINLTGYNWIEVASFLILIIMVYGTWQLFIDSINLVLDAVPKNIAFEEAEQYLKAHDDVTGMHDLYIWAMSTTANTLLVHLVISCNTFVNLLKKLKHNLHEKYPLSYQKHGL